MVFYFFSHLVSCSPRVDGFVTMMLNFQSMKHVTSFLGTRDSHKVFRGLENHSWQYSAEHVWTWELVGRSVAVKLPTFSSAWATRTTWTVLEASWAVLSSAYGTKLNLGTCVCKVCALITSAVSPAPMYHFFWGLSMYNILPSANIDSLTFLFDTIFSFPFLSFHPTILPPFLFWGYTQQYSGHNPGSPIRNTHHGGAGVLGIELRLAQ